MGDLILPLPIKLLILSLFLLSCEDTRDDLDCAGIAGGNATVDCTDECDGSAVQDECGVCNGDGIADGACDCAGNVDDACGICGGITSSADECPDTSCDFEVCISIINVNDNSSLDIWMNNSVAVAGFQFNITGISNISPSGGLANQYDLSVSTANSIILGFSLSAKEIPPSNDILIHISFTDITDNICIENAIFSDTDGDSLGTETTTNCFLTI